MLNIKILNQDGVGISTFLIVLIQFLMIFSLWIKAKEWKFSKGFLNFFSNRDISKSEYEEFISELAWGLQWLSQRSIGSLIIIEKKQKLDKYVGSGYAVLAKLNPEFLINIFTNKSSAMHDGGVIVRGLNIISVSSYFPITANKMGTTFGARHRAAIGITEKTDSIALIVSETTGKLCYSLNGKLQEINTKNLSTLSSELSEIFNFYIN